MALVVGLVPAILGRGRAEPSETPPLRPVPPGLPDVQVPSHLTLADALQLLRTRGLDLLIADTAVESARGDERIARALANPAFSGVWARAHDYDPTLCPDHTCSATQWTANLSEQGLVLDALTGKRRLRIQAAKAALGAAQHGRADVERTLGQLLKQQYLAVALAQAGLAFARESAEASDRTLRLVEVRHQAGAVSEADVARAEVVKLEADQSTDQAVQGLRQARVGLAFLLGVRGRIQDFEVGDELLRVVVPARLAQATPESLLSMAEDLRPDLRAVEAQRRRATAALELARRRRLPDVQISFDYTRQGSGQSAIQPPTAGIGVALALPLFYRNQGEIEKAGADLRTQELQWAKTAAQVRADVEAAWASFVGARGRAERMESRLLARSQRARELVGIQYEKGAASLLELLDAQRTLIATHLERLHDLDDYWTAVFALEAAVGTELRE